ncbi:hypothetical protein FSARC_11634 [Fusarium sarcochroum]|uniref:2EXR domain-containing protein n=1 Tax=Fusarium sarcochroum TaxID=1208366 RepID=A0A8H4TE13_9HYPO|nr:hypothetical protein FSARC_11634 [Fusarium sarcochroum]
MPRSNALSDPQFKPFPRLPLELRLKIWDLALASARSGQGVCILPPDYKSGSIAELVVENPYTSLLGVSADARRVALKKLPWSRKYDPDTDILFVDKHSFYKFCDMCSDDSWPSLVHHLALALSATDRGLWLPIAMKYMPSLKSISVVYPKTTGISDVSDDVIPPTEEYMGLRKLTEDEMETYKIYADYLYETHFGDMPIIWTKTASEHVHSVRVEMTISSREYHVPCWDEETESLDLLFEARCFKTLS